MSTISPNAVFVVYFHRFLNNRWGKMCAQLRSQVIFSARFVRNGAFWRVFRFVQDIKTNLVYFSYDIKNDDRKSLVPLQVDNQIMNRGESYENSEEDSLVC